MEQIAMVKSILDNGMAQVAVQRETGLRRCPQLRGLCRLRKNDDADGKRRGGIQRCERAPGGCGEGTE